MFYLVCYDVIHDRRRDRVSRLLEGYVNPDEDQIRFYPMSPRHRQMVEIVGVQPQRQVDDSVFIV